MCGVGANGRLYFISLITSLVSSFVPDGESRGIRDASLPSQWQAAVVPRPTWPPAQPAGKQASKQALPESTPL